MSNCPVSHDALDNSFATICRQPVPDTRPFKVALRLLCLPQFERDLRVYEDDDANYLMRYCKEVNRIEVVDEINAPEEYQNVTRFNCGFEH